MPQIDTRLPPRMPSEDEPQSVIHAPSDYRSFESNRTNQKSPTEGSENTVVSPPSPEVVLSPVERVSILEKVCQIRLTAPCAESDTNVARQYRCASVY